MKTVIVCTTSYHPFLGGAEVAIEEITKRLSPTFRFFIVTARQDRKLPYREIRPEGTVIRIGMGNAVLDKWILVLFGSFFIAWNIKFGEWRHVHAKKEISLFGVDISQGALMATCISFLLPRVPFVLNLQYGYGDQRIARGRGGAIQWALKRMLARADYVTAISHYLLNVARQYGYKGGAVVIPNGVAIEAFTNKEGKKTHRNPTIITVSRLVTKNGVDVLIRAVAKIKEKISDVQLIIVGDGPEREKLHAETRDLGLEKYISFLGSIPNSEVPRHLHDADVFVRPSRSEGMGNVFIEALTAGLPIIGTPVGGITDIIEKGKTGLFTNVDDADDLADKIIQLLNNHTLSQSIVDEGQKMARERFSWEGIAKHYNDIFGVVGMPLQRIVAATPLYPPDIGGPATYVHTLIEEMPQLGIGVSIAYFGEVRTMPKVIRHVAYFLKVFFKARGRDIVFAQDPVSTGSPALVAATVLRKKFIVKIVGDYAWEQWQQDRDTADKFTTPDDFQDKRFDWKTEIRRKIERTVARSAEKVIVPSDYLKKIVLQWGVREELIFVVPNAFDVRYDLRLFQKKVVGAGKTLVTAGRLVPWKGFEALISLIPRIRKVFPSSTLTIFGDGPLKTKLEDLVRELQLEDAVHIAGSLEHKDFLCLLSQADIFILNTGYEGLSHVLLESMALGIPIVTTNVCGNPELIKNGVSGMLVDYNDSEAILNAVIKILNDTDIRESITLNAKEKIKEFSREKMIENTKKILLV